MSDLPSVKARVLLRALLKYGFTVTRVRGSHRFMSHADGRTLLFAFHDRETIGPRLLAKILKDADIPIEEIRRFI